MFTTETFADIISAALGVVFTDFTAGPVLAASAVLGLALIALRRGIKAMR